ncbi:uncharacterized protein MELLADRAFT_87009 [Melampsora larici-populina 98AG31]|uniref:AVL9/DENND6 domain-containing protein n=1 Tax=Melampsora larici-populina (strain 98AG31 / pathotype 3-4-7) TaxID=747676 RepID=F4R469_MELLP|nr:uncharacterized protein MELLADRAFT_87009 [Melampsora larici-populina 98AG31]EGG13046.1 hypothetical protein MELLADRAFT_87009 [Melampsora larici-populina 98AG31]
MPGKAPLTVYAVVLISFDHALGPTVEWSYPPSISEGEAISEQINRNLPFLALPDGAHLQTEDYSYFHLFLPHISTTSTVFGISQLAMVLANQPVFGCIRDKLGVVTRALFAQRDFADRSILEDFYHSLEASFELGLGEGGGEVRVPSPSTAPSDSAPFNQDTSPNALDKAFDTNAVQPDKLSAAAIKKGKEKERAGDVAIYMGTNLRELIHHFRLKTLQLVKLLMLQRRIMFYGHPVESLCTYQYSLVSLLPCLLVNLEDSGSPMLAERAQHMSRPSSLQTSDRQSLLRYFGLPLDIFGQDAFFQPYLPLQQIDMLKASTFLVGTTNTIFQQQRDCHIDAIANIELATLEFKDPKLASLVALTPADRKWMDEVRSFVFDHNALYDRHINAKSGFQLIAAVDSSWNPEDPSRPIGNRFVGSDDYLRREFEGPSVMLANSDSASASVAAFNEQFIHSFKTTCAFQLWDRNTDSVIFDLIDPRHPCEGRVSVVEDVGIRLTHGFKDLKLDETLSKGSESVWRLATSIKTDIAKRQAEYRDKLGTANNTATSVPSGGEDQPSKILPSPETVDASTSNSEKGNDSAAQPTPRASLATTFSSFLFGNSTSSAKPSRPPSVSSSSSQTVPAVPQDTPPSPSISTFFRYS